MKKSKFLIAGIAIFLSCLVAILVYNDKIEKNSPTYYKQGVLFYNKGDYSNAYYNFNKIRWISPLYTMALFKQAKSAQKIGDYSTAADKYKLFLEREPNSIFSKSARYNLAKCYYHLKKYQEAKKLFEQSKEKNNNINSVEDYYLGMLNKNSDELKANEYFTNYLTSDSSIDKNYEIAAIDEFTSLKKEMDKTEIKMVGEIYLKNNQYKKALTYLSKLPLEDSWDYLVLANHYAGNKLIAKTLIEKGLVKYSKQAKVENLNKIYNIYASYLKGTKVNNWMFILNLVQDKNLNGEDYVLYKLAGLQSGEKAYMLYSLLEKKYPNSNYAPESLWNVFWYKYNKQEYNAAAELAYKHLKQYKNVNSTPKIAFWLAKTELKQNKINEAHNILNKIIAKYPDDYYALRSEYLLNKRSDFWNTDKNLQLPQNSKEIEFPISLSELNIKDVKLINSLFELGDYDVWLDADFKNKIVESWFEQRKGKISRSAILARDAIKEMEVKPSFLSAAYKLAYPLHYSDEINIVSKKLEIDPYYVISIIKEESHFDPNAKSSTMATGLMQLMPSTANFMISKHLMNYNFLTKLQDSKTNIYIGTNYIKYLKDKFNNDLYVTAAYNAGEGYVVKWLKQYRTKDNDEFIESIPFEETRNYIKKVYRTYHLYKKIYK